MTAYTAKTYANSSDMYSTVSHLDVAERSAGTPNVYQNVPTSVIPTNRKTLTDLYGRTPIAIIPAQWKVVYSGGATLGGIGKTFKMRGWYSTGSAYEYWTSTSPGTPPPSGHMLTDITVMGKY